MRQVQVLTWRDGEPDPPLGRELATVIPSDSPARSAVGVLDLPHPDDRARGRFSRPGLLAVDALWWTDGGPDAGAAPPANLCAVLELTVDTHLGWESSADDVDATDAVKQVSFLHASAGTSLDEFREHYRAHVAVARCHMPALWQYRQHDVVDVHGPSAVIGAGIVAVSELWFRSTDDFLHRYFASPADEAEFRSHEGFLDLRKAFSFVCASHTLPAERT